MEKIELARDFKEFLGLLNSHEVEYMLIGGYAFGFHGYPRTTNDLDIWIAPTEKNAEKVVSAFQEFGFSASSIKAETFSKEKQVVSIGVPPICIEILTSVSGLRFDECYDQRVVFSVDQIETSIIGLADLKIKQEGQR